MNQPMYEMAQVYAEPADGLLTAREAAAFLRVSLNTLWRMERRQLIVPYRTPGGHRRYSVGMLRTYLERTRVHA